MKGVGIVVRGGRGHALLGADRVGGRLGGEREVLELVRGPDLGGVGVRIVGMLSVV